MLSDVRLLNRERLTTRIRFEVVMKIRTIPAYVKYCKQRDEDSSVNSSMIHRLIKEGQIRSVKIGNRYVVDSDTLDSYFMKACSIRYDVL